MKWITRKDIKVDYLTKIDWRSNFQCTMRCLRIVASKSTDRRNV